MCRNAHDFFVVSDTLITFMACNINDKLMTVTDRFLKYVTFDTESSETTGVTPSTPGQRVFAEALVKELEEIGLEDITLDDKSYLMATLPANTAKEVPTIGFIAHLDTSPDMSGKDVEPRIVSYEGGVIVLCAEAQFVHLGDHRLGAARTLDTALGQFGERRHAGGDEEHGRTVLARRGAGSAADAGGGVHRLLGVGLRDRNGVGVGHRVRAHRDEASGLQNLVVSRTVHHEVLDDGERCRAPRLDGDRRAVLELAHVDLAGRGALAGTVGRTLYPKVMLPSLVYLNAFDRKLESTCDTRFFSV